MAESEKGAKAQAPPKAKEVPTEYVVLELVAVPKGGARTRNVEGWVEVGETDTAKAKSNAEPKIIAAVVRERAGTFKAVSKRAWRGGVKRTQKTVWESEAVT